MSKFWSVLWIFVIIISTLTGVVCMAQGKTIYGIGQINIAVVLGITYLQFSKK